MKIAFLNIYQGLVERGGETFVLELSKRLEKNHEVKIIPGDKVPPKRWPILWRFFVDPQGLTILFFTIKNLALIWNKKFDVVIPLNGGWQPALIRILTWLYGGRMVISGHSGIGWDDRNNLWCFPNYFVAISSLAKKWARKVNPFVKVKYIPNGVDLKKFKPEGTKFKTDLKHPMILCVGNLVPGKRINLAIRAVAKINNTSLLVVGDGDLKKDLETLGDRLLGNRFKCIKLPYERMPQVYRATDVFSLPSLASHSFEIVIAEAMATNLPVVVNDDPIRKEIVGNAGFFVDPTDINAYAQAIEKALKTKWGNKPRKQAEKFDWDKIAKAYENLFNKIV